MIYFGVPLRSKGASKNWENVTRVFNRTLRSIYRQADPDFRIIVACHDVPELDAEYDDRVEFLTAETPVPRNMEEMMLDKGWKLSMIGKRVRELGGGYTMLVDADDMISNRIAEYVKAHPDCAGFVSKYGYVYNEGFSYMKKLLSLHRICGSCTIVNYRAEELPDALPENLWDNSPMDKWAIRKPHRELLEYLGQQGKALSEIPFPTTVYLRNTGDNHSMFAGGDLNWKRKAELLIRPRIPVNGKIGEEFGF